MQHSLYISPRMWKRTSAVAPLFLSSKPTTTHGQYFLAFPRRGLLPGIVSDGHSTYHQRRANKNAIKVMFLVLRTFTSLGTIELLQLQLNGLVASTKPPCHGHGFAGIISPITQRALYIPSPLKSKPIIPPDGKHIAPRQATMCFRIPQNSNRRNETKTPAKIQPEKPTSPKPLLSRHDNPFVTNQQQITTPPTPPPPSPPKTPSTPAPTTNSPSLPAAPSSPPPRASSPPPAPATRSGSAPRTAVAPPAAGAGPSSAGAAARRRGTA